MDHRVGTQLVQHGGARGAVAEVVVRTPDGDDVGTLALEVSRHVRPEEPGTAGDDDPRTVEIHHTAPFRVGEPSDGTRSPSFALTPSFGQLLGVPSVSGMLGRVWGASAGSRTREG